MPLALDRFSIKVTVSQATHDKLRRAQALLRHAVPSGDVAEVLDRALDALIEKVDKRRNGTTNKPRNREAPAQTSRHIPNHVKRAVVRRDENRCAYVAPDGTRCSATSWLEFDHIIPVAHGGASTVDNVRQCCRAHNQHRARQQFGERCSERQICWQTSPIGPGGAAQSQVQSAPMPSVFDASTSVSQRPMSSTPPAPSPRSQQTSSPPRTRGWRPCSQVHSRAAR
jgi:hypothetical protein